VIGSFDRIDVDARIREVRRNRLGRWRATVVLGLRMTLHAKAKFVGTLLGVTFAVLLANFQLGTLFGLLEKNTVPGRSSSWATRASCACACPPSSACCTARLAHGEPPWRRLQATASGFPATCASLSLRLPRA
jgi:hypothetical protein